MVRLMPVSKIESVLTPVLVALALAGCDAKKDEAPKTTTKTVHECTITVAEKAGEPETFKGKADGADEKAVEKEAWDAACAALPEADRPDCRDTKKFKWASGGGSATSNGVTNYSRTITLTRVVTPKEFEASSKSDESEDAACKDALTEACKAAGATGDCVAAGSHDRRGLKASKTTETVEAK